MGRDVTDASDAALVVALARCHRDALVELYRRHAPAVYALAQRLTMDQTCAEKVVDDVFLDLWRRAEELQEEDGPVRSWLMAQAYQNAAEQLLSGPLRRPCRRRSPGASIAVGSSSGAGVITSDPATRMLASLPAEERDAVGLASFPGHTYRDVAMLLGEDEAVVNNRIRRGLRGIGRRPST